MAKNVLKLIVPILGYAALLRADDMDQSCLCPKTTCCQWRAPPPCECVTRSCDCGVDFFITGDFTYWKAREDGLEFAMVDQILGVPTGVSRGPIRREKMSWEPGFKVGCGLDWCDWGWDTFFNYTWYRMGTEHTVQPSRTSSGFVVLDAYWHADSLSADVPLHASAAENFKLNLNILDWEMGRKFWIGKKILLRPQIGLKGVWNKQTQSAYFYGVGPLHSQPYTKNNEKCRGVGLRAGLDAAFHFTRNFSFIGKFALTGLYERFKVTRQDFTKHPDTGITTSFVRLKDRFWNIQPILEWFLGFEWESWWSCDNYHFAIWAGWEEQWWAEQARFIRLPGSAFHGAGDLSLQGLTAGVMFEF